MPRTIDPDKRVHILRAIEAVFARKGRTPTALEIMREAGLTNPNLIRYYIHVLADEGYLTIKKTDGKYDTRTMRLTNKRMFM